MKKKENKSILPTIPVIDIFAGPGGLGEGFSAYRDNRGRSCFNLTLSIEKEEFAHKTLRLRSFFRQFGSVPDDYYRFLRNEISEVDLYQRYPKQAKMAALKAWKAELGVVPVDEVDRRVKYSLGDSKEWVLIGGPPCQAYSIIGRSRYSKIWKEEPEKRDEEPRHFLYREYLRILSTHQPPIFLLENVKGLLSSIISSGKIADKIFEDLRNPCQAIDGTARTRKKKGYRLFSVVREPRGYDLFGHPKFFPEDYIIRCEKYGIPQARHRIIILGIREDLSFEPEVLEQAQGNISIDSIISDLPKIRSGLSKGVDSGRYWLHAIQQIQDEQVLKDPIITEEVRQEILTQLDNLKDNLSRGGEFLQMPSSPLPKALADWLCDAKLKGVLNHSSRSHITPDLQRYFFAACFAKINKSSPKLNDFPKALLPDHRNVAAGVNGVQFADRFRVQFKGRPSTTITSHISKDGHYYIHFDPLQCRSLTVREAARLQTFSDNYYFMGPRTSQYHQVGNAVPPLLAYKLAEKVFKIVKTITADRKKNG
jgi:DNA (cytosine-5)-methyltransferase 1